MILSLEWTQHIIRGYTSKLYVGFDSFCTHLYFLVGTDCARSQWFEVGGTDIKNQGNTMHIRIVLFPKH